MKHLEWTYDYLRNRAVIFHAGERICEVVCTHDYMTQLLSRTTLESLAAMRKKILRPEELIHLLQLNRTATQETMS